MLKIIKEFHHDEFAKSRDQGISNPFWTWGIDKNNNLYFKGRYSGYVFDTNWRKVAWWSDSTPSCPTLEEMNLIVSNLIG